MYRDTLAGPFTVWSRTLRANGTEGPKNKESGPLDLKDAYQIMLRRKREKDVVWVEDYLSQVVDFDKINAEGRK